MKYVLLFLSLFIVACDKDPQQIVKTSNAQIDAGILFEIDGYRVYRFHDAGENIYFVTPTAGQTVWNKQVGCGENCERQVPVIINTLTDSQSHGERR